MRPELLEYLICPICHTSFRLHTIKKQKDIDEGILYCKKNHKFKIKDGIPRLVVDKSILFAKTEKAFSTKWKKYGKHIHSQKWYKFQQDWFIDRFGWKTLSNFQKFLKTREHILDAGAGIGNIAKLLSANPNSQVFALDASESIYLAYKKYSRFKNIHFLQADLRQLPFRKGLFDFIVSDQVLHHTNNTEHSFKYLSKFLKKEGQISIYVYKRKGPIREFVDDYLREHTTNMSEKECIEFSKDMTYLGKSLSKLKRNITIRRDIPLLKIKAGTYDIQRFIYWNVIKCFWMEGDFEGSVATNFDWYYPKYAFRHTSEEIKQWCNEARLKISHIKEIESGISMRGTKL